MRYFSTKKSLLMQFQTRRKDVPVASTTAIPAVDGLKLHHLSLYRERPI